MKEETEAPGKFLAVTTTMNSTIEPKKDHPNLSKIKPFEASTSKEEFGLMNGDLCKKYIVPVGNTWLSVNTKYLQIDILKYSHKAPSAGHLDYTKDY